MEVSQHIWDAKDAKKYRGILTTRRSATVIRSNLQAVPVAMDRGSSQGAIFELGFYSGQSANGFLMPFTHRVAESNLHV